MKAILLAAGLGTRLSPITNTLPKCLVEIKGKPLLAYWLETLVALGIEDILINLHYLPEQVRAFIASSPYKKFVTLIEEKQLLGTAGTLVNTKDFWAESTTMVIHADNFCTSNLIQMVMSHKARPEGVDATLLLFRTENPKSCGIVNLNKAQVITEFHEKVDKPPSNLASGALFIFSPIVYKKYFAHLIDDRPYELSVDVIPNMMFNLKGWEVDGFYIDIGTPEALIKANNM